MIADSSAKELAKTAIIVEEGWSSLCVYVVNREPRRFLLQELQYSHKAYNLVSFEGFSIPSGSITIFGLI